MRRRRHDEAGQVLPLLLCGVLVVMLGCAAFAIDVGRAYYAKRQLQASVDAAALAGAQNLPDPASAMALAGEYGPSGKNPPGGVENVQVSMSTRCLKSAPGCAPANALVVEENASVPTKFARVLGIDNFNVHAKATACSPCGQKPLDVMLVLDRTGSMCDTAGCTDLNNAVQGIKTFLGEMDPEYDQVGLAVLPPAPSVSGRCQKPPDETQTQTYDSKTAAYVVVPLSTDYLVNGKLNNSSNLVSTVNCIKADGWTAYATALEKAQDELDAHGRSGVQKVIVFLSDGAANTGPAYLGASSPYLKQPCHQGITSAQSIAGSGTMVFTIGYDLQHDTCRAEDLTHKDNGVYRRTLEEPSITAEEAMRGMASSGGYFYNQPDAGQLNTIYTAVAADILHGTSKLVDDDA
jgi:hypothetical protein